MRDEAGWGLGIPDEEFHQRRPRQGLITKMEVRAIALAKLGLQEDSVVWDIGAGSGSVSIEASLLVGRGRVFAIEKNPEDIENIRQNIEKFGASRVQVVKALAPQGLEALPDPDAIFIGGSGGNLEAILEAVGARLRPGGRVVVNVASVESLGRTLAVFTRWAWPVEATLVSIARSRGTGDLTRFEALNPVFILCAWGRS